MNHFIRLINVGKNNTNNIIRTKLINNQKNNNIRKMASYTGPPLIGWRAKVREACPHDYQIVFAVLGIYTGIFVLFKLKPSKKIEEIANHSNGLQNESSDIPSIIDESWETWSKIPGNLQKWEQSLEKIKD